MRISRQPVGKRRRFRRKFHSQAEEIATRLNLERFRFGGGSRDGDGISRKEEKGLLRREKGRLATKQDLQERRRHQLTKFLQLREEGGLTPEWKIFGKRHDLEIKAMEKEISERQEDNLRLGLPRKEVF